MEAWIDNELLRKIRDKNRAHANKERLRTAISVTIYNKLRNQVNTEIRSKKKEYFRQYFEKFNNNSKKLWEGINLALEQTVRKITLPSKIKDIDGKEIEGDQNIADSFAKYFEHIPGKTKAKIKNSRFPYLHYLNKTKPSKDYLVMENTNPLEVCKLINKLKDNSSPGPFTVPNKFLKLIAVPLSHVLAHIINRSLLQGYVPKAMKVGKQTPVFKSGEQIISNYRPITVCGSISKIVEQVVKSRVMQYLERVKILNNSQFGFRKKHSTGHAVINLTECTLDMLDSGLKTGNIYLDVSKAFDCIDHRILLRKLEHYGFRGATLMWFEPALPV